MADVKRNIKDSVFTFLFSQPEYTRELYLALHPEETDISVDDCKIVTLENILSIGQYNDLGIQVNDRILLLVEAQSTFSENITLRMLMYLAETYKQYVEEHKLDLYAAKPVKIPRPELYVVYTGKKEPAGRAAAVQSLWRRRKRGDYGHRSAGHGKKRHS